MLIFCVIWFSLVGLWAGLVYWKWHRMDPNYLVRRPIDPQEIPLTGPYAIFLDGIPTMVSFASDETALLIYPSWLTRMHIPGFIIPFEEIDAIQDSYLGLFDVRRLSLKRCPDFEIMIHADTWRELSQKDPETQTRFLGL